MVDEGPRGRFAPRPPTVSAGGRWPPAPSLTFRALGMFHRRAAGEAVRRGQFIDLILVAKGVHELDEFAGERGPLAIRAITTGVPGRAIVPRAPRCGRPARIASAARRGPPLVESLAAFSCTVSVSYVERIFRLRSKQHGRQGVQTGAEKADCEGSRWDRPGQFLLGSVLACRQRRHGDPKAAEPTSGGACLGLGSSSDRLLVRMDQPRQKTQASVFQGLRTGAKVRVPSVPSVAFVAPVASVAPWVKPQFSTHRSAAHDAATGKSRLGVQTGQHELDAGGADRIAVGRVYLKAFFQTGGTRLEPLSV